MSERSLTQIEERADSATKLPAFGINLPSVRNAVERILSEWKSSGVFYEYTDHSFQHVTDMLRTAEWVIPQETQGIMTSGDWLMLTLAFYLHDIGLLVTKREFDSRGQNPDFISFKSNPILLSDKYNEFTARLALLEPSEADRVQYQEFVRASHGKRVRAWIEGGSVDDNGATKELGDLLSGLLSDLDKTFRRD